jgi:hypothetical protein
MSNDKSPKETTALQFVEGGNAAPKEGGNEKHSQPKAIDGIESKRLPKGE